MEAAHVVVAVAAALFLQKKMVPDLPFLHFLPFIHFFMFTICFFLDFRTAKFARTRRRARDFATPNAGEPLFWARSNMMI